MKFLELVQRLHSESLKGSTAPTAVTGGNDRQVRYANAVADAWRELQSERDWRWMRASLDATLVVNQQTYTATALGATRFGRWRPEDPEYCVRAYAVASPDALWTVNFWQLDQFRDNWIYRDMGASNPFAWTIDENDQLLIGPRPSEAFKLRIDYWKEPSELAADTDTPDLPDRFKLLPMWRALQEIAKSDAAPEVLARADTNYALLHGRLMADQARRPTL